MLPVLVESSRDTRSWIQSAEERDMRKGYRNLGFVLVVLLMEQLGFGLFFLSEITQSKAVRVYIA